MLMVALIFVRMKPYMIVSCFLVLIMSCSDPDPSQRTDGFSDKPSNAADSLFDDVMKGHDAAMARMGKLKSYYKQVEQKIDSLTRAGGNAKSSLKEDLSQLGEELKAAEGKMNTWMEDFNLDSAQNNAERRINYLKSEKLKVNDVRDRIFRSLDKADSMLSK